ncbi:MAG: hypothetical protein GX616_27580, partial [Planctomycetes bacterium]|nr:hypothetical protein [Planctomycetota bacterium]
PAFAGMGRVRDEFSAVLQQAGVGAVGSKMHGMAAWARGDDLAAYSTQARHAAESVMQPSMWGGPGVEERREQAAILRDWADTVDQFRQTVTAQRDAAAAQTRAAEKLQRTAGGPTLTGPRDD